MVGFATCAAYSRALVVFV
jgi:hypothetical protein